MNHLFITSLFFLFILTACSAPTSEKEQVEYDGPYFHAKPYFQSEIERIKAAKYTFQKQVTINGTTEVQDLDTLNLAQELQAFIKNDINRPAYVGRYETDSTFHANKALKQLTYTALDDKLPVQQLDLEFNTDQNIQKVIFRTGSNSRLIAANSIATYEPAKGYQFNNEQKIALFGEQQMEVKVVYVE